MHHAAATPKTRFSGTAMAAVSSVRRMADSASGSFSAAQYAVQPALSASTNTAASGSTRNSPMKPSASAVSSQRMAGASVVLTRRGMAALMPHPRSGDGPRPAGR